MVAPIREQAVFAGVLEKPHLLGAEPSARLEQVRPAGERPAERLYPPPPGDRRVVARTEYVGHQPTPERRGPRVLRILEQTAGEALVLGGSLVAEDPQAELKGLFVDDEMRKHSARKHVVADIELRVY